MLQRQTLKPEKRAEYESELTVPPMPDELAHVWSVFCRLNARRRSGFAIEPIAWGDLDAFLRLTGVRLSIFEIQLIEMLDDLFRAKKA